MAERELTILGKMEAELPHYSRQERKIAMQVIQNPNAIEKMNIKGLAKITGVGSATITRFVRKIGCADFASFKLQLAIEENAKNQVAHQSPTLNNVSEVYVDVLQSTWNELDPEEIEKVVDLIKRARRIYTYGLGSSGYSALEMGQRLTRMGLAAFATVDSHMMFINAEVINETDLLLVLSSSGETDELNEAVALAKQQGVPTVAIVGDQESHLAKMVTVSIQAKNSSVVNNQRFVNSQFSAMFVLDILTTELLKDDRYNQRMNKTIQLVLNRKYK